MSTPQLTRWVSVVEVGWATCDDGARYPSVTFAAEDWNATAQWHPRTGWQIAWLETLDARNQLVRLEGVLLGAAFMQRLGGRPVGFDVHPVLRAIADSLHELGRVGAKHVWRGRTFEIQISGRNVHT